MNKASRIKDAQHEKRYLESLDLFTERQINANSRGNSIQWYGSRLEQLLLFYKKTRADVASACFTSGQNVSFWISNTSKPNKGQIKQLSFMFEIEPEFFFLPKIVIMIEEQNRITFMSGEDYGKDEARKTSYYAMRHNGNVGNVK